MKACKRPRLNNETSGAVTVWSNIFSIVVNSGREVSYVVNVKIFNIVKFYFIDLSIELFVNLTLCQLN